MIWRPLCVPGSTRRVSEQPIPLLTDEDYRLALLYAEAYPISGRPRRPGDSVPTGSIPRSSKQVRRKQAG